VKRGIVVCLVVVAALAVVVAAAAGRDPRLEKLRLAPADGRLARAAVVRRSDLPAGWAQARPTSTSDQQAPVCPGYRPNFSKFTLTGQADSRFSAQGGASSLNARVEVYKTKAQARGDFALSTRPPVARCLSVVLQRETAKAASSVTFVPVSSRRVQGPRLGERSVLYRVVGDLSGGGARVRIYVDAYVVLRGRSIGTVFFTGVLKRVAGQQTVATRMARRLR
jgi:hypothetical protein